jgi:glycoprotein-N-acetylgalactosamine 3-beta-galactosyltransferase
MAVSDTVDPFIDSVDIAHAGPEKYNNIWQKVRSIWSYVYDHYYDKYDWFHIGGDDLFLIVDNLRHYVESEEIQTAQNGGVYLPDGTETSQIPLYLGLRFKFAGRESDIFNSGGPGYTLNKAALKMLVVEGIPQHFTGHVSSAEDAVVARILRQYQIYPYETKDEHGSERYMHFDPGFYYDFNIRKVSWLNMVSINVQSGINHSSPRSVAFHYVKEDMRRLHWLLYNDCPNETRVEDDVVMP